jgi:hypothetical protein
MDATVEPPNRRPSPEVVGARHAEIDRRYARHNKARKGNARKGDKLGFANRVLKQLQALFVDCYGLTAWPDDDAARDDIEMLVNYLVINRKDPRHQLSLVAPWLPPTEVERLVQSAERFPIYWTQAKLGQKIGLTYAMRKRCKAWNIDPIDCTLAECRRRSREEANQKRRRRPPSAPEVTKPRPTNREQMVLTAMGDGEVTMAELVRRVAKKKGFRKLAEPRREVHKIVDRLKVRGLVDDRHEPSSRAPVRIVWKVSRP